MIFHTVQHTPRLSTLRRKSWEQLHPLLCPSHRRQQLWFLANHRQDLLLPYLIQLLTQQTPPYCMLHVRQCSKVQNLINLLLIFLNSHQIRPLVQRSPYQTPLVHQHTQPQFPENHGKVLSRPHQIHPCNLLSLQGPMRQAIQQSAQLCKTPSRSHHTRSPFHRRTL